jgi:hypothetical protein
MISRLASLLLFSIASSVLFIAASYACSPSADFKGPLTNFELVQQADVIFIGKLVRSVGNNDYDPMIIVEPQSLLKGRTLPKTAQIRGYLSDRIISDGGKQFKSSASPSDPYDIWRPHSEVWSGSCSRYSFNQNSLVVLFFKDEGGKLEWLDPIFARGSEDVYDEKALWVRAVKLYANISQLAKDQQRAALTKEMKLLRSTAYGDSEETLLADDIERQLSGCGPISYFDLADTTCSKSQWIYNIANIDYQHKDPPSIIEVKTDAKAKSRAEWIPYGAGVFALSALGAITFLQG